MFDTNYVELDSSKLIHTDNGHYAISDPHLPSKWKMVSVNGDDVNIVSNDNISSEKRMKSLTSVEKAILTGVRSKLVEVIHNGPYNVKSSSNLVKLTTFDRNGGTSTMGTGSSTSTGTSSSSSSSSSGGGMTISRTGPNSYIVSKTDFPLNWQRIFVNEDHDTIVFKDGRVSMMPESLRKGEERVKLISLKQEVDRSNKVGQNIANSMLKSMGNPFDFVNKAMGNMFG